MATLPPRARALAFAALVLGGVGIGVTEFVTMGLLPQIAEGVGVSVPRAADTISAYALGVVVGSPLVALGAARRPKRTVLVLLMVVFTLGNIGAAVAPDHTTLVLARFVSGLPHGGFFALASLIAVALAAPGQGGRAVGTVMLGIPLAMVIGVPLGTWAGQALGWRVAYWGIAGIGVLTALLVLLWVPWRPGDSTHSWRTEMRAFTDLQFWLTMLVGAVGFGGMFAMYSYVAPTLTEVTGLDQGWVPVYLLIYGLVSIVGTWLGGRLGDWSVPRTLLIMGAGSALALLALHWASLAPVTAALAIAVVGVCSSAWVVALQLRLMAVAGAARTIGAAMNHSALNLANALGAWVGGLVITAGYGYRAPALVGAALSVGGLLVLGLSLALQRRRPVQQ